MTKKPTAIPKFRTEVQEAQWWDAHPKVAAEIMRRALKSGKTKPAVPLKPATTRLPVA